MLYRTYAKLDRNTMTKCPYCSRRNFRFTNDTLRNFKEHAESCRYDTANSSLVSDEVRSRAGVKEDDTFIGQGVARIVSKNFVLIK